MTTSGAAGVPAPVRRVLVVDDSRSQRRILTVLLRRWGYSVSEAGSGAEALEACAACPPDIVISDWMMPGMNGPDLCRRFREMPRESYGYFILLTSKSEKGEVAHGFEAGADDFLTKPVTADELRARLNAGERILRMEGALVENNRLLSNALSELEKIYDNLDRDLREARELQQSLLRERQRSFGPSNVSLLLRPSGHVGGDLVGFFPINAHRVALFAIDVSGHGVASAFMTARLAGFLSGTAPDQNVALYEGEFGIYDAHPPERVAAELNRLSQTELKTETYFTLLFADLDLVSGRVRFAQAGHPHPAILRADGSVEFVGEGGMPVGLLDDVDWQANEIVLHAGDRLFITSDGVTECESPSGQMLDQAGLAELLHRNRALSGQAFMEALTWDLTNWSGNTDFQDDVSAILVEFGGPKRNAD